MRSAGGLRLLERPRGGAWPAAMPLPGNPEAAVGPVLDAAGTGALAIAWRVDRPRSYTAIAVAVRDPGGTLSAPIQVAGAEAGGVRHPAIAVDRAGDALLAYHADTRATHLNRSGAIAIAHRNRGGAFSSPTIVDPTPSGAPVVAIGRDGTGVVAWARRNRVHVVSVGARIASPGGVGNLVAAAGSGGAATLAGPPQTIASTPNRLFFGSGSFGRASLDANGAATVLYVEVTQVPTVDAVSRLLTSDGR